MSRDFMVPFQIRVTPKMLEYAKDMATSGVSSSASSYIRFLITKDMLSRK